VLLAQAGEVVTERVELAGGLRRRSRALEDPCGGAVRVSIGALEHLVGDALVDRKRVGGPTSLAALREPQPKVGPERVPRSCGARAPSEFELLVAKECSGSAAETKAPLWIAPSNSAYLVCALLRTMPPWLVTW
jgi:hypothetical protein